MSDNPEGDQPAGRAQTLREKWHRVSVNNKLIVVFAGFTTLATLVYSGFAGWQIYEIKTGAEDTHTLAVAAKRQAEKAETISTSMTQAVTQLTASAAASQTQATAAQNSVKAIQRQMRVDQRPWVRPLPVDASMIQIADNQPIMLKMGFMNLGKTPATYITARIYVEIDKRGEAPKLRDFTKPIQRAGITFYTGILFPNGANTTLVSRQKMTAGTDRNEDDPLTPAEHADLLAGNTYVSIHGMVGYVDIFQVAHWTKFCYWSSYKEGLIYNAGSCSAYNSVDDRQ